MKVKSSLKTFFAISIFMLFVCENVLAAKSKIDDEVSSEFGDALVRTDDVISNWFNSVTQGVDLFLVGKRIAQRSESRSEIVLSNTTYSREGNNFTNLTTLSVNPRFPNLEAYWNLKFSTYDDTAVGKRSQGGYARQTPRDQRYAATVGLFRKLKDVRLAFQPRIELQDPLKVSHFLTAESVIDYTKFQVNPKLQFFADATAGTGTFQALNFNFPIDEVYSFAFLNEGEYEEKNHKYSVINGFSIGHILTKRTALAYGLTFYSNNQPNYHLDAYSFSLTWTEVIYKKLMDYQLGPHLDFVRDEDYRGFVGLVFEFNLRF
jgi:hypothetical protein